MASRPEQVQFQPAMNCFAKADAFRGQNGWTGKPKGDIWIADSQVNSTIVVVSSWQVCPIVGHSSRIIGAATVLNTSTCMHPVDMP